MAKRKKYMSKMSVTFEMLEDMLFLPEGIRLRDIYEDPNRQIVSFILEGDSLTSYDKKSIRLFEVGEGQEIPNQLPSEDYIIERMRARVEAYDKKQQEEEIAKLSRIISEVIKNAKVY